MWTLLEQLISRAVHDPDCHAYYYGPDSARCTCGLAALVAQLREAEKPRVVSGRELMNHE